jgi:type IV secretion system protein VirB1
MSGVLEATAILGHLVACAALHPEAREAPPGRVLAVAEAESGRRPTAIGDNTGQRTYFPATPEDAVALARRLIAAGHDIDAGAMQVTRRNWAAYGLTVETVFDPAANICAGARILGEAYLVERRAACRYNTGRPDCRSPTGSNGYPERVTRAAGAVPAAAAAPLPSVAAVPGPCGPRPPSWDGWAVAAHQACERRPVPLVSHPLGGPGAPAVAALRSPVPETP